MMIKLCEVYYLRNTDFVQTDINIFRESMKENTIYHAIIETFTTNSEKVLFNNSGDNVEFNKYINKCLNDAKKNNVFIEVKQVEDIAKVIIYYGGTYYERTNTK